METARDGLALTFVRPRRVPAAAGRRREQLITAAAILGVVLIGAVGWPCGRLRRVGGHGNARWAPCSSACCWWQLAFG